MSAELIQKVDTLAETVKTLAATVETLSKAAPTAPPELAKALADIGDLKKHVTDAQAKQVEFERGSIIAKMQSEGRVALDENGVGIKTEDLQKMELPLLKFAARNSQVIPLVAKAVYISTGDGPDKTFTDTAGKKLTGSALTTKAWEADYGDIEKMVAAPVGSTTAK